MIISRLIIWSVACYGLFSIYCSSFWQKIIHFPYYNVLMITVKSCYYVIESFLTYLGNKVQEKLVSELGKHIENDPNIMSVLLSGDEDSKNITNVSNDIMESEDFTNFDMDEVDDMNARSTETSQDSQKEPSASSSSSSSSREELAKKLRDKRKGMQSQRKGGNGNEKIAQITGRPMPKNIPPQYQNLLNGLTKDMDMSDMMSKIPAELKDASGNLKTDKATLMKALSQLKKNKQ